MTKNESRPVRLQKYLAESGVASRRAAEVMIREGRIAVNERTTTGPGSKVIPGKDRVKVDGEEVAPAEKVYLLLNKPRGCLTSLSDRFQRPLVRDFLPPRLGRIFPVGRLDFDTEGLLLLTNDGEFCQRMIHPRYQVWKTYRADLRDPLTPEQAENLKRGVKLDAEITSLPARVRVVSPDRRRVEISIREGRKRQVKRMALAAGNRVTALKRVSLGPLRLRGLEPGQWRRLSSKEVAMLLESGKMDSRTPEKGTGGKVE